MRHAARFGACEKAALLCGRAVFGGYFLYSGVNHLMNRQAMSAYASSKRVPYPDAAVMGTGAMLVLGALGILTGALLYLLGLVGEVLLLTAVYLVMPVGRLALRHALMGGIAAALLWEVTRHVLVWYYASMSQIQMVYGSFTTAVAVLLSVEFGAIVLLYGAQVIAEYERIDLQPPDDDHAGDETGG